MAGLRAVEANESGPLHDQVVPPGPEALNEMDEPTQTGLLEVALTVAGSLTKTELVWKFATPQPGEVRVAVYRPALSTDAPEIDG